MTRFVGIKNNKIRVVCSNEFLHNELNIIQVPDQLNKISSEDLIDNYIYKNGKLINKLGNKSIKDLKIAFVSNWKMKCGIASYFEYLFDNLLNHIDNYKLFIEENDFIGPLSKVGDKNIPTENISICWKRGEPLSKLAEQIKEYDPDIVFINHEWGLFPNARYWLSLMSQLSNYRVITTMHSVYNHEDKSIVENSMKEIIVHLDGAKFVLQNVKHILADINVIPHGCSMPVEKKKLWNFYKSNQTFIQFGYGFAYKGFSSSIVATSILKQKYPNVFFTALFSESSYSKTEHENYFNELLDLVDKLNLKDNVALIRGYQSDVALDCFIRINKAAIFPYVSNKDHECYGSSGAAPYAMSKSIPVITSNIHHFTSLPTIKANTPEEIADSLDKLFSSKQLVDDQIKTQNEYLTENSWANTALKYIKIFEK